MGTASFMDSIVRLITTRLRVPLVAGIRTRVAVDVACKRFLSSSLSRRNCSMTIAPGNIFVT
jgi:hypothetical protein